MKHPRLYNQLRIHWYWIRKNKDYKEVYKLFEVWLNKKPPKLKRKKEKVLSFPLDKPF